MLTNNSMQVEHMNRTSGNVLAKSYESEKFM